MIVENKHSLKQNKIRHLKIKNYKFERAEHFKYLGVILNPSEWGHLNPSSYCDVGRFFYGAFKF